MSDWKNVQYKGGKMRTSEGGGGGSSTFAGLEDVSFNNIQNGQVAKYNSTTQKWENANESGGGGHTYSTTEQVIGTWTDGRPIYEITKEFNTNQSFTGGAWNTLPITIPNIDFVVHGVMRQGDGQNYINYPDSFGTVDSVNGTIRAYCGIGFGYKSITIQYTKTTD
jgi:hypothetical protein